MSVVDNAIYVDGKRAVVPDSLDQTFEALQDCPHEGHSFGWIGMLRPDETEVRAVAKEFGLHALAVEDTINAHQRPKLEFYGEVMFVVLRPARYVDSDEDVDIGEVHLFLGHDFVITVRHAVEPDLGAVRARLESDPDLLRQGPNAVLYAVLDKVVDDYGPVLDGLKNDIDEIEVQVFQGEPTVSRRIYQLSREVIEFQRAVDPLTDLLDGLRTALKQRAEGSDLEMRRLLRDVADHATRTTERLAGFRELLTNILQVNATLVGQRQTEAGYEQNEQVKRISSWAAIFFAPSFVASVYGMNFRIMPELDWTFGYPFAVAMMLLLAGALYWAFKRKGWL